MNAKSDILEIFSAAGASAEEIPRNESWALMQTWREIYCAPVHAATGKWVIGGAGGYSWHTFSYEYFPCLEGRRALAEYSAQPVGEIIVLTERCNDLAFRSTEADLPDFSDLYQDVYVAPSNFAWSMVFTHERDAFGPYFSRADWLPRGAPGSR